MRLVVMGGGLSTVLWELSREIWRVRYGGLASYPGLGLCRAGRAVGFCEVENASRRGRTENVFVYLLSRGVGMERGTCFRPNIRVLSSAGHRV